MTKQISDNFSLGEFTASSTAGRLGHPLCVDSYEEAQIGRLVTTCLQPAREEVGAPFTITSGYRPPWLNKHIRGAKDSRHMYGCAADFKTPGIPLEDAFHTIRQLDLPVDQLILEDPPDGWIHLGIALPGQKPRKQYMIATRAENGRMIYSNLE